MMVLLLLILLLWWLTLTLLDAKAGGPLLQGDVVIAVGIALLEEAGGAMLHGNEGGAQGRELGVGEETGRGWNETNAAWLVQLWVSQPATSLSFNFA